MGSRNKIVGQIVEILANSKLYIQNTPKFDRKEEELKWLAEFPKYSLFDGILIGGHTGIENYRLGQRKGLNISGHKLPLHIISFDKVDNRIFVGGGSNHPGLFRKVLRLDEDKIDWETKNLDSDYLNESEIIIKNTNDGQFEAILYKFDKSIYLEFKKTIKVFDITPELYFYKNENYLGKTNI